MTKHARKLPLWFILLLAALAVVIALALVFGQDWLDGWKSGQTERQVKALYAAAAEASIEASPSPASAAAPSVAMENAEELEASPSPAPVTATPAPPADRQAQSSAAQITPVPTATVIPKVYRADLPPVETPPPVQADFEELYTKNQDVIGWLTAGDRIDYPVVWREGDNDFYLSHDIFKKNDRNGTLFLNGKNRFFPGNDVWLIHGHNMRSGAMFGTLHRYRQLSYVRKYPLITFRTIYDAEPVYYVAIAGFDASMTRGNRDYFDITQIAFPDDDEVLADVLSDQETAAAPTDAPYATPTSTASIDAADADKADTKRHSAAYEAYLTSLREASSWMSPADVNVDDSLLMLITCSYSQNDGRFILVCRKLREDEDPEEVAKLFETP